MSLPITIRGEEGRALVAKQVDFSTIASDGSLSYSSMDVDELTFTIAPQFLNAKESEIPEEGQTVELFIQHQRVFSGIVTRVTNDWGFGELVVEVTVSGPWWWLRQTPLSELINETTERPQFRCSLGGVEGHIARLFARLNDLGIPVALGGMDACYEIPTTTFSDASFAKALSELVRYVPDAVGWWDYSGEGLPKFRLSRRSVDHARTLVLGSDEITEGSITAEYGLQIAQVSVPYAERLQSGETAFREQKAGLEAGTRQIMPVSGPELVDFVPPDPIDGFTLSTIDIMASATAVDAAAVRQVWPFWVEWLERNSGASQEGRVLEDWFDTSTPPLDFYTEGIVPKVFLEDGTPLDGNTDNRYAIIHIPGQEIPPWLEEVVMIQKGYIRGTFYTEQEDIVGDDPDWMTELVQEAVLVRTEIGGPDNGDRIVFFEVDIPIVLLDSELTDITYYEPLSYTFETPPNDFAENLRQAQSWLPYSGHVELERDRFERFTGSALNVANGRPAWETMGALVQGETLDLFSMTHRVNLGLSERFSGVAPTSRLDRNGQDSVILL